MDSVEDNSLNKKLQTEMSNAENKNNIKNEASSTVPDSISLLQSSERANAAPVTLSTITTSAEITPTTLSCSKLRSVPIPQPLILKRRTSKSSISSIDDNSNEHQQSSKLTTPVQTAFDYPTSPTGSMIGGDLSHRRSFLTDIDYSSSPGSDFTSDIPQGLQQQFGARSPPATSTSSSSFSPRYSSPPAGSGGKYMVRSKRASWIDGSSSMTPHDSTPSTPTTQPTITSKPASMMIPPLGLPKPIQQQQTPSSCDDNSLKSGSLSKLREDRQHQYQIPRRENSLDSAAPLSASSSTTDNSSHSFLLNKTQRKHSEDATIDVEDLSYDTSRKRSSVHERKPSVSSIVTDCSMASEEIYSPLSSPHRCKPNSSNGPRSASASPLVTHAHVSSSTPHTPYVGSHKARRRSSMSMLRNIPSSELADIISGNSPNPILEGPAPTELASHPPTDNVVETQPAISPSGIEASIPSYQHSLHSLLRKQLSSKRKPMRDRRSLPSLDGGKPHEADKDVVEMSLDAEPLPHIPSTTNAEDHASLKSPVYPAMLLNETQLKVEDTSCKPTARMFASLNSMSRTSAPDMLNWNRPDPQDYFSDEPSTSTAQEKSDNRQPPLTSTPLYGTKNYATYGSDEDYAKKLYMSRSAKVKRWCSAKAENIEDRFQIRNRHRRSNSSASTSSVPAQETRRFSTTTSTARVPHDDFNMPTILVTTEEEHLDQRKKSEDNHEMVNIIPWVDWLEEYRIIKAREIRRRSSTQGDAMSDIEPTGACFGTKQAPPVPSISPTETHGSSVVNRVLSNWWNNVKTGAEHYSKSRHQPKKDSKGKAAAFGPSHEPDVSESMASPPPPPPPVPHPQQTSQHPTRNSLNLSLDLHELQHPLEPQIRPFVVDGSNSPALMSSNSRRWSVRDMDTESMSPMSLQNHDSTPSSIPDSPLNLAHRINNGSFAKNPITQKSLAKRVGYRFYNPGSRMGTFGQLSHVFGNKQEDDSSTVRIQHSIKSRLQFAKEACNAELRQIIDGLNEYVERGLQYVEDMDEILEEGMHSVGSLDTDDDDDTIGPLHNTNSLLTTMTATDAATINTSIPPITAGVASSPVVNPDTYMHQLPSVVEIDETPSPPSGPQQHILNTSGSNNLPHKRSLSSAMDNDHLVTEPSYHKAFTLSPSSSTAMSITSATSLPPTATMEQGQQLPPPNNAMVAFISEDSYLPTPFILTLQDLISVAQNVMDTSLDDIIETSGACAEAVARIQAIGVQWDIHPEWPCREWYVRLLLGIAALNRVVEWWAAERGFWTSSSTGGNNSGGIITAVSSVAPSDTEGDDMDTVSNISRMEETEDEEESHMSLDEAESQRSASMRIKIHDENNSRFSIYDQDAMEDEQLGSLKLQEEAERSQNSTIIVELSLGTTIVQYVSPVWFDVVGTDPQSVIGHSVTPLLSADDSQVFSVATEELLADDSHTVEVRFNVIGNEGANIEMEGKGMLMYNRVTGEPSHTMWVMKPVVSRRWSLVDMSLTPRSEKKSWLTSSKASEPIEFKQDDNQLQQEEQKQQQLTLVPQEPITADEHRAMMRSRSKSEPAIQTPPFLPAEEPQQQQLDAIPASLSSLMSLPPVLCRVCERSVVAAFFEQHSELCVEIHQSEMDVNECNDNLMDLKHIIHERMEAVRKEIENLESTPQKEDHEEVLSENKEGVMENAEEDSDHDSIFGDCLPLEDAIHPLELRKGELDQFKDLLEIIEVALSISTPGTTDSEDEEDEEGDESGSDADGEKALQSPRSKDKMVQIIYWRPPTSDDPSMSSLIKSVQDLTRSKVDAVNRMRDRLEYNSRARAEFQKNTHQNPNWTEFISESLDGKKSFEDSDPIGDEEASENKQMDEDKRQDLPPIPPPKDEMTHPTRVRRNLLSRLDLYRKYKPSGVIGRLSRKLKSLKPDSTNTPIVEMETIDTPIGSPGLRPNKASPNINKQDHLSSGSHTPNSGYSISASKSPSSPLHAPVVSRPTFPSIKDFDIIKPISKGAFGSVFLAKKRTTGDYYAIKFLKKSDMIAKNQVTNVKAERMILMSQTDSPFVTKLYYTFQSKDYLYLVLEYLNGGDCSALIKVIGSLPEDWTRNYLAEVTLGLEYLQSKNVIHRDLKPDNLLIDQNGHLKLTDFGLSRIGFLDRRVRDELTTVSYHDRVQPISPAPSRSGTPPQSPAELTAASNGGAYRHSYFSLLFDQHNTQGSPVGTPYSGIINNEEAVINSGSPEVTRSTEHSHRRHLSAAISESLSSGITSTSMVKSDKNNEESTPRLAVGTPDYLAPESILGTGQDSMVDWWALGVICYEFLYGIPPFNADTPDKVFENILSRRIDWHEDVVKISPEARDFMERLMTLDPEKRLGYHGAEEVKQHPFFKSINWDTLMTESPSFIPQPADMEDTDYFDARGATMQNAPDEINTTNHLDESAKAQVERAKAIIREQNPENLPPMSDKKKKKRKGSRPDGRKLSTADSNMDRKEDSSEGDESDTTDFGTFTYKNLPVLEKANEDMIRKIRHDSISASAMNEGAQTPSKLLQRKFPAISSTSNKPKSNLSHDATTSGQCTPAESSPSASVSTSGTPLSMSPSVSSKLCMVSPPVGRRQAESTLPHIPTKMSDISSASSSKEGTPLRARSLSTPSIDPVKAAAAIAAVANSQNSVHPGSTSSTPPTGNPHPHDVSFTNMEALSQNHPYQKFPNAAIGSPLSKPERKSSLTNSVGSPPSSRIDHGANRSKPLACLVADDNPISCKIIETILQMLHCRCVIVRNGAQAIRSAMSDVRYDIIFMDIRMPIIDGETAARMIKSTNNSNRETPIIAVTAYERTVQLAGAFDDILSKPVTKDVILQRLKQFCRVHGENKEHSEESSSKNITPSTSHSIVS